MSDRKRENKASKSSYMRAARKQRMIEERYADFGNKEPKKAQSHKNKKNYRDYDDYE